MKFKELLWFLDRKYTLPAFELESVGITHADPAYRIRRPDGANFYTFEYVISGHGVLCLDGTVLKPEPGDVWLLPAHVPVEYWSDRDDPWEKLWINIAGALPENLITTYQLQRLVLFRDCRLEEEFRDALEIVREHRENAAAEFAVALLRIVTGMAACRQLGANRRNNEMAIKLKHHLETHWREPVRLRDLAALIARSPAQVLRIFSAEWGCTPGQWLQHQRFEFARQYLTNTNYTVRAIAEQLGFKDEFYFANWFKQRAGCAPGSFRHGMGTGGKNPKGKA